MSCSRSAPEEPATSGLTQVGTQDRDVVTGFPVKKLTLMILFANMMFVGFIYLDVVLTPFVEAVSPDHYGNAKNRVFEFADELQKISTTILELPEYDDWILWVVPMLGTVGGLAWYLVLRWRESRLIRKRREALLATLKAEAG